MIHNESKSNIEIIINKIEKLPFEIIKNILLYVEINDNKLNLQKLDRFNENDKKYIDKLKIGKKLILAKYIIEKIISKDCFKNCLKKLEKISNTKLKLDDFEEIIIGSILHDYYIYNYNNHLRLNTQIYIEKKYGGWPGCKNDDELSYWKYIKECTNLMKEDNLIIYRIKKIGYVLI
jgi:hypothetical protein